MQSVKFIVTFKHSIPTNYWNKIKSNTFGRLVE